MFTGILEFQQFFPNYSLTNQSPFSKERKDASSLYQRSTAHNSLPKTLSSKLEMDLTPKAFRFYSGDVLLLEQHWSFDGWKFFSFLFFPKVYTLGAWNKIGALSFKKVSFVSEPFVPLNFPFS